MSMGEHVFSKIGGLNLLPKNNGNLTLTFLVVITHLFSQIIFINYNISILTGTTE